MADNLSEFRRSILGAINRQSNTIDAQRAYELGAQTTGANAFGAAVDPGFDGTFSTGYDSGTGLTTVPFTVDISLVGGDDIVTGS
jgi:hypothetical protein